MENHDTFNFSNVLEFDNWIIVGLAMWKMLTFFWPLIIVSVLWIHIEKINKRIKHNEKA
tara:strand:- start:400 stop:576 length:177 start_codon:yes stop_codon:yes gene_type:complete